MNDVQMKNQMINEMLAQHAKEIKLTDSLEQVATQNTNQNNVNNEENEENEENEVNTEKNDGTLKKYPVLDKETREKFRELVNMYIQADDLKKKIQAAQKEQNAKTKKLSHIILMFMTKYNASDLISSDGVCLRCRKTTVKEPLSAKTIKERIEDKYEELKGKSKEEIEKEIFERKDIEKVKLVRLKKSKSQAL